MVRTLACHARGRRFEPVPGRHLLKGEFRLLGPLGVEIPLCTLGYRKRFAQIAQLVEQWTENPRVAGSIPALGMLFAITDGILAQSVEHLTFNQVVRGSNPRCLTFYRRLKVFVFFV